MKVEHCSPSFSVLRSCEYSESSQLVECQIKEEVPHDMKYEADSKKGICLLELHRANMPQWNARRLVVVTGEDKNHPDNNQNSSCTVVKDEDGEAVTAESLVSVKIGKRDYPFEEDVKPARRAAGRKKTKMSTWTKQRKTGGSIDRWSAERYNQAEQRLLDILRAEGAQFGHRIARPQLRTTARKRIGDTGLLDHLLKHIDGKVAPGGKERFRRWHNPEGVMEYWLESADLDDIRREAGVQDPFWVPPSWWKPGSGPLQQPLSTEDVRLLQEEMINMKRGLEELAAKKKEQNDEANLAECLRNEFIDWKAKMNHRVVEITSSLAGMQEMYRDLITWKDKTEHQLCDISNSLSSMQASKQYGQPPASPPHQERWEDWLDNTTLNNIPEEDISWLVNEAPIDNIQGAIIVHDPNNPSLPVTMKSNNGGPNNQEVDDCAKEVLTLKEEIAKLKSQMKDLAAKKQDEDFFGNMHSASFNIDPKLGRGNPWQLVQEMVELLKWKPKMEQQLMELSNAVCTMQTPNQLTYTGRGFVYDRIRG